MRGLIVFVGRYLESGSRIGIHIISHFKDDRNTSRATNRSLEGPSVFIELNLFLYVVITTRRRQPNPAPAQPASPSPPPPRRRRKPQNPWVLTWILQREERGCYRTLLDELITSDIPGYRNFTRMEPAFFYMIEEIINPPPPPAPPKEVTHQLQAATRSRHETGNYFETLINRGKLHFTAIPMEG